MKRISNVLSNNMSTNVTSRPKLQLKYLKIEYLDKGAITVITINRPKKLNALSNELVLEIVKSVYYVASFSDSKCIILTGSGKAFAAGADIGQLSRRSFVDATYNDPLKQWERIGTAFFVIEIFRDIPIIAAVNGYALGGGCEIAMMCDIIIASEDEIRIGTIPGVGGTQRLTKTIGKSKSMELILTGSHRKAIELEQSGLVSKVVPRDKLMAESLKLARKIARNSRITLILAKRSVNEALNLGLEQGLMRERALFHSTLSTEDRTEGMAAFQEKRNPKWSNK